MTNTKSTIEWTDTTWNPTTGYTKVSPGCDHCYAEKITERFHGKGSFAEVKLHPDRLDAPLRWRKPRRVFVNSMSDLFHKDVPDEFVARVFAVMGTTPRHVYQILTKRHGRMQALLSSDKFRQSVQRRIPHVGDNPYLNRHFKIWPLPNLWLGVSVEDQQRADLRIPSLLDTPAAVRFLSCEPLLGPVQLAGRAWLPISAGDPDPDAECLECGTEEFSDVGPGHPTVHRCDDHEPCFSEGEEDGWCDESVTPYPRVDWVIAGGESGPGARPMHPDWARSLRDQCQAAGVPYFFKQWGEYRWVAGNRYDHGTRCWVDDGVEPQRVGKKAAGRELDGCTWNEFPAAVPA